MIWEVNPGNPLQFHPLRWISALVAGYLLAWCSGFTLLLLFDTLWGAQQLLYNYEFGSHHKLVMQALGMIRDSSGIVLPLFAVAGIVTSLLAGRTFSRALLFSSILSAALFFTLLWLRFSLLQSLVFTLALVAGLLCTWLIATGAYRG